ncbi:cell division protein FtsB [uncultured Eubacterium sp.]|nr:cell division protein FtsB [uncultured Eubacterium sp.]
MTVIVVVLIAVVGVSIKNVFDLRAEQDELRAKNKQLASEKASLKDELKNVNDYDYIEEQARIQLKLIRPGEILYVLDDEGTETNGKDDN